MTMELPSQGVGRGLDKGLRVRSSFKLAGKKTSAALGVRGSSAAALFEEKCCKCRFTIKHTSANIQFHKQQWLPQLVATRWERKSKVYRIENPRSFVGSPVDPYQGNVHFFNPKERTYEYVTFDTGFCLKPSSDQFIKKTFKVMLYGMNEFAAKQKQAKVLGTAEVDLSSYAFEAYTSPRNKPSIGTISTSSTTSSNESTPAPPSRLLRIDLQPKSEKVVSLNMDVEISCAVLSDSCPIDDEDDMFDAGSTSCGGSTNGDVISLADSDMFRPSLDGSLSRLPPASNGKQLTRFQTFSSGDMKNTSRDTIKRPSLTQSFRMKTNHLLHGSQKAAVSASPDTKSSSNLLKPVPQGPSHTRTASLSPARDAQIRYTLPPVNKNRSASSVTSSKSAAGATKGDLSLTGDQSKLDSLQLTSESRSVPTIPEVLTPVTQAMEINADHAEEWPSAKNAGKKLTQATSKDESELCQVDRSFAENVHKNESAVDCSTLINSHAMSGDSTRDEPLSYPTAQHEEGNFGTIREGQNVSSDHPLILTMQGDKAETFGSTPKVNPFLLDNADDHPFTSAESLIEREKLAQKDLEMWISDVIRGYPRVGGKGAKVICHSCSSCSTDRDKTLSVSNGDEKVESEHHESSSSSDQLCACDEANQQDNESSRLTCGITLCAILHRFNPQLIGNFNWLLEENDTESERYFKLALSTCKIVSIQVNDLSSNDALQIATRIHAHYVNQPIPALPDLGDPGSTEQFELRDLERTEDIKRKIEDKKASRPINPRLDRFAGKTRNKQKSESPPSKVVEMEEKKAAFVSPIVVPSGDVENTGEKSSRASSVIGLNHSLTAESTESKTHSKSTPQPSNKLESAKSLMFQWGSKLKTKIEEANFSSGGAGPTATPSNHNYQSSPKASVKSVASTSEKPTASKEPIVYPDRKTTSDLDRHEPRLKEGGLEEKSNGTGSYQSEQEMCEALRRNWRTMIAKKRLVLENRIEEIDSELCKLRTRINKKGVEESVIVAASMDMIKLTNEKSDLMLEFDDIEIMEEDLELQEKADQVKHQLMLLQLNSDLTGTEAKEDEERRLVELFRSYMDERNALVEKVDNRNRPGDHDEDDQPRFKLSSDFLSRTLLDKKGSKAPLIQQYLRSIAHTRYSTEVSLNQLLNGHQPLPVTLSDHEDNAEAVKCGVM